MTNYEVAIAIIAVFYVIFALDDLFFDCVYWLGRMFNWWERPVVTTKELKDVSEWRIAIVTPAWKEQDVIARMLMYNLPRIDYQRYDYWIGTYQNDPDTRREVDKVRSVYPNVRKVVTDHDGPTSKADCVNAVLAAIAEHEERAGLRYDLIVFHDVEDLIHPQELRLLNWYFRGEGADFVQLPVLSTPPYWYDFVAGTYIDEFAEQYTKNMFVREKVWGFVPSAGVATCVRRSVIDQLMEERNGVPFAINSLTEDYDLGLGLTVQGRPTRYLHQYVKSSEESNAPEELVATWAPFPQTFRTAVRQRTRWMAGIVFQGWEHWGWPAGLNWILAHDRRGPLGYLVVLAGYLLVVYYAGYQWIKTFNRPELPDLVQSPWFQWLFWIGFLFMLNRLLQRALSTGRLYGFWQAMLAIFRTPFSNIVNLVATMRAALQYTRSRRTGIPMSWDKTEHSLPPQVGAQMRLGERLIEERKLTTQQLVLALKQQREHGGQLGAILVNQGVVSRDDLEVIVRNTKL